jgi:hypothetical protein
LLPVVLLVTALIVYGSLYPWQFHAARIAGNPLLILLYSWPLEFDRFAVRDMAINVVLYIPFGASCYLWLSARKGWIYGFLPLLLGLLLSSSIEMIQLFDAQRVTSMMDVVTNVSGTAVGVALAWRLRPLVQMKPRAGGPLMLLFCWAGALLFPFMPDLSTHHLIAKIAQFTSPPFAAVTFFNLFVMWLAAARVSEVAMNRYVAPLLLLVLPVRFLVAGLTLRWTDVVPAVLALFVWFFVPQTFRLRDAGLAVLSIGAILMTGLSPFHFSAAAQTFSWVPFRALFSTDWEAGFGIFFRKCFAYGSAIWLGVCAGFSLPTAAIAVAALLAGLEVVQMWLPNHAAETTDPILALVLAWVLSRMHRTPTTSATQLARNASVRL